MHFHETAYRNERRYSSYTGADDTICTVACTCCLAIRIQVVACSDIHRIWRASERVLHRAAERVLYRASEWVLRCPSRSLRYIISKDSAHFLGICDGHSSTTNRATYQIWKFIFHNIFPFSILRYLQPNDNLTKNMHVQQVSNVMVIITSFSSNSCVLLDLACCSICASSKHYYISFYESRSSAEWWVWQFCRRQ